MNLVNHTEIQTFHDFVAEKLKHGAVDLSPEEAFDQWRAEHPDADELRESVATVRQALDDMAAGDRGRPADEVLVDLRARHRLSK